MFRGFDNENKKWVYGYYTKLVDGIRKYDAIIAEEDGSLVRYYIHDKNTISQFTGKLDKNKVKIFDRGRIRFLWENEIALIGKIFYNPDELRYEIDIENHLQYTCLSFNIEKMTEIEVLI